MTASTECKLCLSDLGSAGTIMHTLDQVMESIIGKYLWAELVPKEKVSNLSICNSCWTALTEFHHFYCNIEKLHSESTTKETDEIKYAVKQELLQAEEYDISAVFINCDEFTEVPAGGTEEGSNSNKLSVVCNDDDDKEDEERYKTFSEKMSIDTATRKRRRDQEDANILRFYHKIVCEACDLEHMTFGEPPIEYKSWSALLAHSRKYHSGVHSLRVRTFVRCPVCDKKLLTRVKLLHHLEFHQHPERFRCTICAELHEYMAEHEQNKHHERRFTCEVCDKKFPSKERLTVHRKKMHLEKDAVCDQCQKSFSRYAIDDHKRSAHTARFACEQCPKTFKIRFRFLQHMEKHNGNGTNSSAAPCPVCGQVMRDKYNLNRHLKELHTDQPPANCDSCGKSFRNKRSLTIHRTNVCSAPAHTFDCAVCGRQFRRRVKLKEHMATHTGKPLYQCSFCPETFRQDTHMYYHRKRVHHEQWVELQRQRKEGVRFKVPEVEQD